MREILVVSAAFLAVGCSQGLSSTSTISPIPFCTGCAPAYGPREPTESEKATRELFKAEPPEIVERNNIYVDPVAQKIDHLSSTWEVAGSSPNWILIIRSNKSTIER